MPFDLNTSGRYASVVLWQAIGNIVALKLSWLTFCLFAETVMYSMPLLSDMKAMLAQMDQHTGLKQMTEHLRNVVVFHTELNR